MGKGNSWLQTDKFIEQSILYRDFLNNRFRGSRPKNVVMGLALVVAVPVAMYMGLKKQSVRVAVVVYMLYYFV
jgi:hypothetical protein